MEPASVFGLAHHPSPLFRGSEIALEDALGGDRVEAGLEPRTTRARGAQHAFGFARGEPLVHECGADAEAALQALREAAGELADRMLGTVGVRRQPDHQQRRPPFGNQPFDRRKARAVFRGGDAGQGMRDPRLEVADRDANALDAEVEPQDGARPGVRREA